MASHLDVMLALLGASAGLAGLVLVFLGLVASATASFPGGTMLTVVSSARRPAFAVLVSFGIGVVCVALATTWLLMSQNSEALYVATVATFYGQLVTLVAATIWSVKVAMWR